MNTRGNPGRNPGRSPGKPNKSFGSGSYPGRRSRHYDDEMDAEEAEDFAFSQRRFPLNVPPPAPPQGSFAPPPVYPAPLPAPIDRGYQNPYLNNPAPPAPANLVQHQQVVINGYPPPNVPSSLLATRRPDAINKRVNGPSRPDRRMYNKDRTMWWWEDGQERTSPCSDRCFRCNAKRKQTTCSLGTTGYPCTTCAEFGEGETCKNGLPSVEWERRMLRSLRGVKTKPRVGGQSKLYNEGRSSHQGYIESDDGGDGETSVRGYPNPSSPGNPNENSGPPDDDPFAGYKDYDMSDPSQSPDSLTSGGGKPKKKKPKRTQTGRPASGRSSGRPRGRPPGSLNRPRPAAGMPYTAPRAGRRDQPQPADEDEDPPNFTTGWEPIRPAGPGACDRCKRLNYECSPERPCGRCDSFDAISEDNGIQRSIQVVPGSGPDFGSPPPPPQQDGGMYAPVPESQAEDANPFLIPSEALRQIAQMLGDIPGDIPSDNNIINDPRPAEDPIRQYVNMEERGIEGRLMNAFAQERHRDVDVADLGGAYTITPPPPGLSDVEMEDNVDSVIETMLVQQQTWMNSGGAQRSIAQEERHLYDPTLLEIDRVADVARRTANNRLLAYQLYRAEHPRAQPIPFESPASFQGALPQLPMRFGADPPDEWQPRIPPPVGNRPLLSLPPFADWNWEGNESDKSIRGPSLWPFTRIAPQQPHGGRYSIYVDNQDANCMELPRSVALPPRFAGEYDENFLGPPAYQVRQGDICGDKPSKACECIVAAQAEHRQNAFLTCLPCHGIRYGRGANQNDNLEARKAFLCIPCANLAMTPYGDNELIVVPECVCQTTMTETWLCHLHRTLVDQEFVAGLMNAEAVLIAMGQEEMCISCGVNRPVRTSGVFSCKICRCWVR